MVEQNPSQAHEWCRNLNDNKHGTKRHGKSLLPEGKIVIGEGYDMMNQSLLVNCLFQSTVEKQVEGVYHQIARCEVASPNVAIPWL
jgi:hypothetical protein